MILGNGVWKTRYGSDPSIVGRTIKVNEVPSTVIGVMPEGFKFPVNADLWVPLALLPDLADAKRDVRYLEVFGRLAPGVTVAQAGAELRRSRPRLAHDYPETNKDIRATVMTFNERYNGGPFRLMLLALMGAVAFVLLIACANVANLLLARSAHRAREVSVRVSLGATRRRIVRQLLVESVLLALISGVLGLALSIAGIRLFATAFEGVGRPYWIQFTIDSHVLFFLSLVALGTGFLFGLAPALHVSKTDVNEVLKEGGRSGGGALRARRWTGALMVAELALTLVLLAGAGFMMRSFLALYRMDLGIDTSQLLTMRLALANAEVSDARAQGRVLRSHRRTPRRPRWRAGGHHRDERAARRRPVASARHRGAAADGRRGGAERDDGPRRAPLFSDDRATAAARTPAE